MAIHSPSRIAEQTAHQIRRSLRRNSELGLTYYASHPAALEERLHELENEWDVERILETDCSASSLLGLTLGYIRTPRWFLLPLALQEFLLQHALFGHCPQVPLLGRLGFRTRREVLHELRALQTLQQSRQKTPVVTLEGFHVRPWAQRPPLPKRISA